MRSCIHWLHTPDTSIFLPFMFATSPDPSPQFSKHQKQHMITYLFLIQMYMIHILTAAHPPPYRESLAPWGRGRMGEELVGAAICLQPSQAAAQVPGTQTPQAQVLASQRL